MDIEVVCVGQAVIDCTTRGIGKDPHGSGKTLAESITLNFGGDALNQSFALARLGRSVSLVCALGRDLAGSAILAEAERNGIEVSGISSPDGFVTPVADLLVQLDGSRRSISSAASTLPGYTPSPEVIRGAKILSLASLFRAPLDRKEVIASLIREAKRQGAIVCADTKLPTFRALSLSDLTEILPMIDYIFPNDEEACYYTGTDNANDAAAEFLQRGAKHVVIKCGAKGICAADRDGQFALPAVPVTVVDTTGGGDHFVAGFIDALLAGSNFRSSCEEGLILAADCISHLGANKPRGQEPRPIA